MAKKPERTVAEPTPAYAIGDRVEIRQFGSGRVVELRGPLGPGGIQIYRVMYSRRPRPAYIEVFGDQLRLLKAAPPAPAGAETNGESSARHER